MSKHHLRTNKECLNCGTLVGERYCTHCGQENTETRQSFGHLVRHIIEDLTHYDSGFWKTMKYLLFRPAFLTKEYLAGKRVSYVPPVRLYIFISFVCFFLPSLLGSTQKDKEAQKKAIVARDSIVRTIIPDSVAAKDKAKFHTGVIPSALSSNEEGERIIKNPNDYTSVRQMDSMQQALPPEKRYSPFEYWAAKKTIAIYQHNTPEEVAEKFFESLSHNLSKALFLFMPIFAFSLWLIQSKRKFMFFDHAIFTLHYFSFVLLTITLYYILAFVTRILPVNVSTIIKTTYLIGMFLWIIVYFYKAHIRLYKERRIVSFVKSSILFFTNNSLLLLLFLFFVFFTLLTLH